MGLDDNVRENLLRKLQARTGTSQSGEKEGQSGPGRGQGIGSEADRAHVGDTAEETLWRYVTASPYMVKILCVSPDA